MSFCLLYSKSTLHIPVLKPPLHGFINAAHYIISTQFTFAPPTSSHIWHAEHYLEGFPGGAVVKNPPANAGDTGSSPGPGRSHMPWNN